MPIQTLMEEIKEVVSGKTTSITVIDKNHMLLNLVLL